MKTPLYIPRSRRSEYEEYLALKDGARQLMPTDTGRIGVQVLVLNTKGNPPRRSFAGYSVELADIGYVTAQMADIFVKPKNNEGFGFPLRFKIENEKAMVIERNSK